LPLPRTTKGKAKLAWAVIKGDRNPPLANRRIRAKDFEEHAQKYYERKYGKEHVAYQKSSKHTRKRPDFWIT